MAAIALIFISPIIKAAISKACSLAGGQIDISLAWGFEEALKDLAETLTLIEGVLEDAESKQEKDRSVALWLQRLSDVAYEAVDLLDEYEYEMLARKVNSQGQTSYKVRTSSWLSKYTYFPLYMAKNIKRIRKNLEKIKGDAVWVQLNYSSSRGTNKSRPIRRQDPRTSCSILDCSKVVGRHNDVSEMVDMLVDMGTQHKLSGVSIVGMGGIGKTTLAKSICQRVKSEKLYDVVAWVCVSEDFDEKRIFQEFLDHLNGNGSSIASFNALLEKLEHELENKKTLLVLDDVWDENPRNWNSLISHLSNVMKTTGNSIMVTTRSDKAASTMERLPMRKHDTLKLSDDECWLIIEDMVRLSLEIETTTISSDLGVIGREIAEKCRGLPLVASVIGGTLSHDMKVETWSKIRDDRAWVFQDTNDEILSVLKISFDRLPSPLKKCFSYCAILPKDYVIEKNDLVHLWMAQGYLHSSTKNATTMEDIGNGYFHHLLSDSFFQDVTLDENGNIQSCKMHDLVHDLALLVSKGDTLIWDGNCDISEYQYIRHLRVKCRWGIPPFIPKSIAQRLHTLFIESYGDFSQKIGDMKSLRSFKLMSYYAKKIPLRKLKHLRYFDISKSVITALPKSIFKQYNLQTLKLVNCKYLEEFPSGTKNLISLRHVCFTSGRYMPSLSHAQRGTLQSISQIMVGGEWGVEELVPLSQVEELNIKRLELARPAATATLKDKKKLHYITFSWSASESEHQEGENDEEVLESLCPPSDLRGLTINRYKGKNWPSWMIGNGVNGSNNSSFILENIVNLTLNHCRNCTEIPSLGILPFLKYLSIISMPRVRRIGDDEIHVMNKSNRQGSAGSITVLYPALIKLVIRGLDMLQEWVEVPDEDAVASEGVVLFPFLEDCADLKTLPMVRFTCDHKLSFFKISLVESLKSLPSGLESCTSLQEIIIAATGLISFPVYLGRLQSLSSLTITFCNDLRSTEKECQQTWLSLPHLKNLELGPFDTTLDEFPFPGLDRIDCFHGPLQSLKLNGWRNLKSLPRQLQHFTMVKTLSIHRFDGLKVLPEWIRNLSSLQKLEIRGCPEIKYLPSVEAMQSLSHLQTFDIRWCPELEVRCSKEGDPEWPKISHIPNLISNKKVI